MRGSANFFRWVFVILLTFALVIGATFALDRSEVETKRSSTCNVAPPDGETAIQAAIEGCPNGSTVLFPPNQQYTQSNRILIRDRRDLIIDGNGSTFITKATGTTTKAINGNWVILRGFNITLRNMTSVGAFGYTGERSLARISSDPDFTEAAMSYGLYGVDTVYLTDVIARRPWGDGMTTGPSEYVDGSAGYFTKNVYVKRMTVQSTARHCWAPTSGTNIWIEDSSCGDAWYVGLDAESDGLNQPLHGLHILRNTFDGFNTGGVFVPVAASDGFTGDIEIRDNSFLTSPDQKCSAPIHIGGYPDSNPATFKGITVTGNTLLHYGTGVVYDHVDGGLIAGNELQRVYLPRYTPEGLCGAGAASAPIRVTNSLNVDVAANAIDP